MSDTVCAASDQDRPHPTRQPSLSQDAVRNLEKRLGSRPEREELLDRNILKGTCVEIPLLSSAYSGLVSKPDTSVAPSLVAAKEKLKRSQLEACSSDYLIFSRSRCSVTQDKLGHAIQQRPKPEELVKDGILRGKLVG